MSLEVYANNATTTLSGSITSGAVSLVVANAAPFPVTPQFRLGIDSELLLVTSVAGTTFGVVRGIEGTVATTHASGATISHVLTSGGLVGVAGSINLSNAVANLPASGVVGRTFFPTDAYYVLQESVNGWSPY